MFSLLYLFLIQDIYYIYFLVEIKNKQQINKKKQQIKEHRKLTNNYFIFFVFNFLFLLQRILIYKIILTKKYF